MFNIYIKYPSPTVTDLVFYVCGFGTLLYHCDEFTVSFSSPLPLKVCFYVGLYYVSVCLDVVILLVWSPLRGKSCELFVYCEVLTNKQVKKYSIFYTDVCIVILDRIVLSGGRQRVCLSYL